MEKQLGCEREAFTVEEKKVLNNIIRDSILGRYNQLMHCTRDQLTQFLRWVTDHADNYFELSDGARWAYEDAYAEELLQDAYSNISCVCDTETTVAKILNKLNSTRPVSDVIRYLPDTDLPESILFDLVVEILKSK